MLKTLKAISSNPHFYDVVLVLLVITALAMGAEATPALNDVYGAAIEVVLMFLQVAFCVEIVIRVASFWPRPQDYFHRVWNSLDFFIVAISLLPAIGAFALIARLFRLARLLRFVSVSGALRNFSTGRTHGYSAVISGLLMFGLLWYTMALAGFYLFTTSGNGHWTSLSGSIKHVGQLLIFNDISSKFVGISPAISQTYLGVLYVSVFCIFMELVSQHLRSIPSRTR